MLKIVKALFIILSFSMFSYAEDGPLSMMGLYYEVSGNDGPWIIFSHGGFGDRRMWNQQIDKFAKEYRVLVYDHRGFGKSDVPQAEYSPVKDLADLCDLLKIDQAHIVGNSMGGILAIDFTLKHPSRVASLIVVASGPGGIPPSQEVIRMTADFKAAIEKGTHTVAEIMINNPMVAITSRLPSTAPLLKTMIDENASAIKMKFWPFEKIDPPAAKRLGEIKVPTLIILGEKDIKSMLDVGEITANGIKGARKEVIPGADHLPQMVDPARFNEILTEFLKGVEASKSGN